MLDTPSGIRLQIGLFGRRNVGKSSLLNTLTGQDVSIISSHPGTTTDVVKKAMELKPLGPVLFLDTAGIDDQGELGAMRVAKTYQALRHTDLAVLVTDMDWNEEDRRFIQQTQERKIPTVIVVNKLDLRRPAPELLDEMGRLGFPVVQVSTKTREGINDVLGAFIRQTPKEILENTSILNGLLKPGDLVVLVIPIDLEAPKGRLILPQVQVIRETLDHDAKALMVKERELLQTLEEIGRRPDLVITDSQVMLKVAADLPPLIPLTSFSILFARWKGDLRVMLDGLGVVDDLHDKDRILILEACAHHPIGEDIGRVKIPRWLRQYTGAELDFIYATGMDLPKDMSSFRLVIQCGGCTLNRREMLYRIWRCQQAGVPMTNYGLVIAKSLGLLNRLTASFPEIADRF